MIGSGGGSQRSTALGQSVFDYIEKQHQRSPIFFNFLYTPDFEHPVILKIVIALLNHLLHILQTMNTLY